MLLDIFLSYFGDPITLSYIPVKWILRVSKVNYDLNYSWSPPASSVYTDENTQQSVTESNFSEGSGTLNEDSNLSFADASASNSCQPTSQENENGGGETNLGRGMCSHSRLILEFNLEYEYTLCMVLSFRSRQHGD